MSTRQTAKKYKQVPRVILYAYAENDGRLLLYNAFDNLENKQKEVHELLTMMKDGLKKTWDTDVYFEFYDEKTGKSVSNDVLNQFMKEVQQ